jgi:hypothetical protein
LQSDGAQQRRRPVLSGPRQTPLQQLPLSAQMSPGLRQRMAAFVFEFPLIAATPPSNAAPIARNAPRLVDCSATARVIPSKLLWSTLRPFTLLPIHRSDY